MNPPAGQDKDRPRRPRQFDVAREANVSQAAVSLVLNNVASASIPTETRKRILDAASRLGYTPHHAARGLRAKKTFTIAAIITDINNPFYPAFTRGIQSTTDRHGYDLIIYNTDGTAERERKCLRSVLQDRVDGVIVVLGNLMTECLRAVLSHNIAVVRLQPVRQDIDDPELDLPMDRIYVDNAAAAHCAVKYLLERGHTRIGMICGQKSAFNARILGYQRALAEHGIPCDDELVRGTSYTEAGGYQGMRELLQLHPRVTAVFGGNDLIAIGAMQAIREAGLSIPRDCAVMGLDDIPAARLTHPALTTIAQFEDRAGRRAAEMLMERLSGRAPNEGRWEEIPFELVVRESA
jgi:LacI family transcriptional regulator